MSSNPTRTIEKSPYAPKLKPEEKISLLTDIATFQKYSEISAKYDVSNSTITHYHRGNKPEIAKIRTRYVNKLSDEKFSHKRMRIIKLTELIIKTEEIINREAIETVELDKHGNQVKVIILPNERTILTAIKTVASIIDQLRTEIEGTKVSITGEITHSSKDGDLLSKAIDVLTSKNLVAKPKSIDAKFEDIE